MSVQNVRHEISEGSNEMFRAIPPNGAAVGRYLCSVCGHRLAMDWLWGGYGEAMGSYVCINLTYRLAMGWLLGGYGEAMGRPWKAMGRLQG